MTHPQGSSAHAPSERFNPQDALVCCARPAAKSLLARVELKGLSGMIERRIAVGDKVVMVAPLPLRFEPGGIKWPALPCGTHYHPVVRRDRLGEL